jgi:tRNA(Ile)-lysidine synthase
VSGGPDSVALAHVLCHLHAEGRLAGVAFAHLNHQLRGADSDADEAFVLGLPAAWPAASKVRVHAARIDVARRAADAGANLEETARRERYRWLTEIAAASGAAWVATGHSADDQAETVLFRLLRGSGLQGLTGMTPARPLAAGIELVRPFLTIRRIEVMQYLSLHRLTWRDDASNLDLHFTRNRIRHELIPHLQDHYSPAVVDLLCRLAAQAQAVQSEVSARAAAALHEAELPRGGAVLVFRTAALAALPRHLVAEVFRQVWRREGWPMGDMTYDDWQRLASFVAGSATSWDFPGRIRASRAGPVLQLSRCTP